MGTSQGSAGNSDFSIYDYGTGNNVLTIVKSTGNVGISTTTPQTTLDVNGVATVAGSVKGSSRDNIPGSILRVTNAATVSGITQNGAFAVGLEVGGQTAIEAFSQNGNRALLVLLC
jgi:hypothetical protein